MYNTNIGGILLSEIKFLIYIFLAAVMVCALGLLLATIEELFPDIWNSFGLLMIIGFVYLANIGVIIIDE